MKKKLLAVGWIIGIIVVISVFMPINEISANEFIVKEGLFAPMNDLASEYGNMTITKDEISWTSGTESQYSILENGDNYCVIKLLATSVPEFDSNEYRFIKVSSAETERGAGAICLEFARTLEDFGNKDNKQLFYGLIFKESDM